MSVFVNDGDGTFGPPVAYGAGYDLQSVTTGDLDGDGGLEMGVANRSDKTSSILWNKRCQLAPPNLFGDLDADGDVDLVDWHILSECIAGPQNGMAPGACMSAVLADLDGDDDTDLRDCAAFFIAFAGS